MHCILIYAHVGSSTFLLDQQSQQDHQWQVQTAETANFLVARIFKTKTNLHSDSLWNLSSRVMQCISKPLTIYQSCRIPLVLGESYDAEMQIISVGTEDRQYACAQQGSRRVLSVPSLLHWAESNLPFFEYLLWECCRCWWSPLAYIREVSTPLIGSSDAWTATEIPPAFKPTCCHGFPDCPVVIDTSLC